MNEALLLHERRVELRFGLNGLLPFEIFLSNQRMLVATFIDVSKHGLGLIVEPCLKVDDEVFLHCQGEHIATMKVRWVKKPLGVTAPNVPIFHRAGICIDLLNDRPTTGNEALDLVRLLETFDCVDH